MKIACVQLRAHDSAFARSALENALEHIDRAASMGAELILLPESLYPSYYLGGADDADASWRDLDPLPLFSGKAGEKGIWLAAGLVVEEKGRLFNGAFLWGPDGSEKLRTFKSNLWHFDRKYVSPGTCFPVVETPFGTVGMIVCADGRIPEICRILALKGAKLVLDLTNLTSTGRDVEKLSNPQLEYMLPARAAENGIWIAIADKVGLEAESVLNCGGSCIIDPAGRIAASAGSWKEEILLADIDLSLPGPVFPERHPSRYSALALPTEETPAYRKQFEYTAPADDEIFTAICRFSSSSREEYLAKAARFLALTADQGNRLCCLPSAPGRNTLEIAEILSASIPEGGRLAVIPGLDPSGRPEAVLFARKKVLGTLNGEDHSPLETSAGAVGAVFGDGGWNPEPARCLMIQGAEIIIWMDDQKRPGDSALKVARTRASENRVFVLHLNGNDASITGPSGAVLAASLREGDQAVSAMIRRTESRAKTVVPGTNIISGRIPEAYGELIASGEEECRDGN